MKVLFFAHHLFGKDGWSVNAINTIDPVIDKGHTVTVLVNEINQNSKISQVAVLRKPLHYLANPLYILLDTFKVLHVINKTKPDIVHFLVEPYAFFAIFIKIFFRARMVLTVCGTYAILPLRNLRTRFFAKLYYCAVDSIIAISEYTANRLREKLPVVAVKIIVIPCGINTSSIANFVSKKVIQENATKQIVFIGEVKDRKGVAETLEALLIYKNKYRANFLLSVIGKFDEKLDYCMRLKQFIEVNGMSSNVKFCGLLTEKEKNEKLEQADLFIMLSRVNGDYFEGFGLVYLEANAYGVPVLGPSNSGAKQAIKDGYSGYAIDANNSLAVAEKIDSIINKKTISPFSCVAWAKEHDRNTMASQILSLY